MDEKFISDRLRDVMLFDDIINVSYCGRNEKGEYESGNIAVVGPKIDVDGVEATKKRQAPGDSVNDDSFSVGEELVDNGTK